MTVEELLDQLDDTIDRAFSFPLSGGRCVVDAERVREIIDDIRLNLPQELKQAKAIVSDRNDIISTARRESEAIIRSAEERARTLVAQEEIIRQAQQKAREMRRGANDFAEDVLKRTEETMAKHLGELRQARQVLRNPTRPAGQPEDEDS